MKKPTEKRAGFTLIELLVVIAIIALLISILLPGLGQMRKTGRALRCLAQCQQLGAAMASYAGDYSDLANGFSWAPFGGHSEFNDLNGATNNWVRSHGHQAVDIVRRVSGHSDGPVHSGHYVAITNRMVNRNFLHLPLVDGGYLELPDPVTVCPEDRPALIWQSYANEPQMWTGQMLALQEAGGDPDPPSSLGFKRIMPFWSTYQFVPDSWQQPVRPSNRLRQGNGYTGAHLLYGYSPLGTRLGNRKLSDVSFPAQKVWVFDLFDRHYNRRAIWHAYPVARQPLLMFDGSVNVRQTSDSNLGWMPTSPNGGPTVYQYMPHPHEPRTLSGAPGDTVRGHFRWTRGGLRGVDFAGGEVQRY